MSDNSLVASHLRHSSREGHALVQAAAAVKFRLQPAQIADDAVTQLKSSLHTATEAAASKLQTPQGLAAAVTGLGFVAAAAVVRRGLRRRNVEIEAPETPPAAVAAASPLPAILGLAVALGLSIGARKVVAENGRVAELFDGLGTEVTGAVDRWARDRVDALSHPGPSNRLGVANLIAMGLGLLAAARRSPD